MKKVNAMCRSFLLGLLIVCCLGTNSYSQLPQVGKPMPDFTLTKILNYKRTCASLKDFRGKWLILDFWISGCLPCIKKFPEINEFQEQFKDQIQFVIVGSADKTVKPGNWNNMPALISLYERISKQKQLNLANAYDSVLSDKWDFHSFPTVYIIDPEGKLRYITEGRNMSKERLQVMLDGGNPGFSLKMDERPKFDINEALKTMGADTSVVFTSILAKFNKQEYFGAAIDHQLTRAKNDSTFIPQGTSITGTPLAYLYNLAFMGYPSVGHAFYFQPELEKTHYPVPVLEIKDKTPFQYDKDNETGFYNYALKVPRSQLNKERLMQIMQNDLKNYFGYTAYEEERDMPVWKLVALPGAEKLLKTKGGKEYIRDEGTSGGAAGILWKNVKGSSLIQIVQRFMEDKFDVPYIDETGINYNIDITIDADMSDREQVRSALQKYGLDLVKGTRRYKVIVVKD